MELASGVARAVARAEATAAASERCSEMKRAATLDLESARKSVQATVGTRVRAKVQE